MYPSEKAGGLSSASRFFSEFYSSEIRHCYFSPISDICQQLFYIKTQIPDFIPIPVLLHNFAVKSLLLSTHPFAEKRLFWYPPVRPDPGRKSRPALPVPGKTDFPSPHKIPQNKKAPQNSCRFSQPAFPASVKKTSHRNTIDFWHLSPYPDIYLK